MKHIIFIVMAAFTLSACVSNGTGWALQGPNRTTGLTDAQSCAVGYDLAQQVYQRVSLRSTTLIPSKSIKNSCERHMLTYLTKAGYRLDSSLKGEGMQVVITNLDHESIEARATISGGLQISRRYRLVRSGVVALTAPSIIQMPANANERVL